MFICYYNNIFVIRVIVTLQIIILHTAYLMKCDVLANDSQQGVLVAQ